MEPKVVKPPGQDFIVERLKSRYGLGGCFPAEYDFSNFNQTKYKRRALTSSGDLDIYSSGDKIGSSLRCYSDERKHSTTPLCSSFKYLNGNCLDNELDSSQDLKQQETGELTENDHRINSSKITKQSFKEIEKAVAQPTYLASNSRNWIECCSDASDSPLKPVTYPKSKASNKRSLLPHQINQIYDELFQIHQKLRCETAAQQEFAEELQRREHFLVEREQLLSRHEMALTKIKGVEEEVLTRFQIIKEQHDAEVGHLTEVLKEKNKESKRLRSSFDAMKELNDNLKKQLNEVSEENRKMEIQAKRVQARLDNLQRKYEFMTIQRLKGNSHVAHEMKNLKQEKVPVSKTYKCCLNMAAEEPQQQKQEPLLGHHSLQRSVAGYQQGIAVVQGCVCQEQKGSGVTGLREFTVKDFHNNFIDLIEQEEKQTSVAGLLAASYDQRTLDYLVVYLQLLASGFLHHDSGSLNTSSKVPLNAQVYELLTVFMDWISVHHLSKLKSEESGMDGEKPLPKFASQRNDIQEKCVKLLPVMTEQLQWMPFVNVKLHEPFVKFIYWSLRQLDAGTQHSTMTSTLRRLGEDILKGVVTKGIQDNSLEHSVENKPKTAAFFKSSSLPLRFLSTLIVLKTVTQADYLAQAFDSLCLDLKTDEGKTLFLEYQAVPVIVNHLRISSKGILSNVIDSLLQMTVESESLQPFLEACSNTLFFRTCSVLLRTPKLDLQVLEKLSIILQKLSKIKSNKKLFELFTIHLMLQEIQRTTHPEHAFLCINLNSTLFNLGLTKCNSLASNASH
ncbi:Coiled-coil domain-containing protein 138 [Pteropus alecto]|uniref:Coiled-coil domain-containing protein 138 n=1 Tax=Pteropus alecto TaxID=9402 RepID=L5KH66_PTEAL|nr:Coiled-coil domain-containing protein 138 [Pteropus alecto]